MFGIIVLHIPQPQFISQFLKRVKDELVVEAFLVGPVGPFNEGILLGLARVDQVMGKTVFLAQEVKRMEPGTQGIGGLVVV